MILKPESAKPDAVLGLRLFGSVARADSDANSDFDVLAVVSNDQSLSTEVKAGVEALFDRKVSISWYSRRRIEEMFAEGHLFAWHLFNESVPLVPDFINALGAPKSYKDAMSDIDSLCEILSTMPEELHTCPANAAYEAGLLFLCMRNIALSASWFSPNGLDFTRYSPYRIQEVLGIQFPISLEDYKLLVNCRLSGQRGFSCPIISKERVCFLQGEAVVWSVSVKAFVGGQLNHEDCV